MTAMPESGTIAVDVGGTFTDVTFADALTGTTWVAKTPSTPGDLAEGFVAAIRKVLTVAGRGSSDVLRVFHGTTTATILAQSIYREGVKAVAAGANPMALKRGIEKAVEVAVEEVKKLLTEAEGFYQSGRYDMAMKRYDQVLNLDPYNTAARKGQERIDLTKYQYGVQGYNETRGRAMWQVEHGWEQPVRQYGTGTGAIENAIVREASNTARIRNKLDSIIIPRIEFRDASIREAIDFLRQQATANDPTTEGRRGVDIVLRVHSLGRSSEPAPVTATTTVEAPALPAGEK